MNAQLNVVLELLSAQQASNGTFELSFPEIDAEKFILINKYIQISATQNRK